MSHYQEVNKIIKNLEEEKKTEEQIFAAKIAKINKQINQHKWKSIYSFLMTYLPVCTYVSKHYGTWFIYRGDKALFKTEFFHEFGGSGYFAINLETKKYIYTYYKGPKSFTVQELLEDNIWIYADTIEEAVKDARSVFDE